MSIHLNQTTARQIVETVKNVCGKDINFIRPDGIIFASTDESRIGDYHEIGHEAAQTGQTIEVNEGEIYHGLVPKDALMAMDKCKTVKLTPTLTISNKKKGK